MGAIQTEGDRTMTQVVLAIIGSRQYDDFEYFTAKVKKYIAKIGLPIAEIVSGGAAGPDDMAEDFSIDQGYSFRAFEADWDKHGNIAGFLRNDEIVDVCSDVIAFWDGKSKGTKDTIDKALRKRKNVLIVPIAATKKKYYCRRKLKEFNNKRRDNS